MKIDDNTFWLILVAILGLGSLGHTYIASNQCDCNQQQVIEQGE